MLIKVNMKRPFLHLVENCSLSVPGNGSGYLVTALNPLSSSTEFETSDVHAKAKIAGRESELYDNPVYDQPKLLASIESIRSPVIGEKEEEEGYSRLASLYSNTSRQTCTDTLTASQTSSYFGRSYDSFSALQCQFRGKPTYHQYEEIELLRRQFNSKGSKGGSADRCDIVDEEMTTEGEGMLTVVNASYEALPCHKEKIVGGTSSQNSVLHSTEQVSNSDHLPEHAVISSEVANWKRNGYKPGFNAVEEKYEDSHAKPSSLKKEEK